MKIGIAGAGIGGLAAAILLRQSGHRVCVFDKFDYPTPVGSGLVLQPVSFGILDQMGIWENVRQAGNPITSMFGTEAKTGRVILDVAYGTEKHPSFGLAIHRSCLFAALFDAALAEGADIETGFDIAGTNGRAFQGRSGATTSTFDLLIDASGAHSVLTALIARALPYGAIWGTVDWPKDSSLERNRLCQVYRRANRMLGVLPVGHVAGQTGDKATIFRSLPRNAYDLWRDQGLANWQAEATGLWPEMAPFVEQVTDPDQMTMARYAHGTLMRPWRDGLAFIGDSAHRASPQLGQGANMAILDAWALTRALQIAHGDEALRLYARQRRWHVRLYQLLSAAFTPQYQSDNRILPILRDRVLAPVSQIWPAPHILGRLVRGELAHPFAGSFYPNGFEVENRINT